MASVIGPHANTPPTLSGNAGVIVMLHAPSAEVNSSGPSGPGSVNDRTCASLVSARLTNEVPESRSSRPPPVHAMSIGAGGGAHTAGVTRFVSVAVCVRSPDRMSVAAPDDSGLAGPGDPVASGVGLAEGDPAPPGAGGEMLGSTSPVTVHAVAIAAATATHALRIAPSLPGPWCVGRTIRPMDRQAWARPHGSVPALLSAGIAFATAGVYVVAIVSQGDVDVPQTVLVTAWIVGLGSCSLIGGLRRAPDRVIALGAATGGLFGAAIISLFSIGALLLVAGVCALIAWMRAGVDASTRQQQLGALAGIGAALGFLAIVFVL